MTDEKLRAEWFWTDRWLSSSGFLLPLEARGLYREMLTRAWSFGGSLPNDPEAIKRLVNASDEEWKRAWPLVKQHWKQNGSKLYNETQREVMMASLSLKEKRALAGRKGGIASGKSRSKPEATGEANPQANPKQTNPLSPSPSLSPSQAPKTATTTPSRKRDKWAAEIDKVLDHFKTFHPRARPGDKAKRVVGARLDDGYSAEDLCQAIDGMEAHPHNQGQNERGRKYLSIEIAMREDNVPRFIAGATGEDNGSGATRTAKSFDAIRDAREADDPGPGFFRYGDGGDGGSVRRCPDEGADSRLLADPTARDDHAGVEEGGGDGAT